MKFSLNDLKIVFGKLIEGIEQKIDSYDIGFLNSLI